METSKITNALQRAVYGAKKTLIQDTFQDGCLNQKLKSVKEIFTTFMPE
jgi:hypothetical protein